MTSEIEYGLYTQPTFGQPIDSDMSIDFVVPLGSSKNNQSRKCVYS